MYEVQFSNSYGVWDNLYNNYDPEQTSKLINPKLTREANSAGTFTFSIHDSHKNYSDIKKMITRIRIWKYDGKKHKPIWQGRVLTISRSINNVRSITVEGMLSCLNDVTLTKNQADTIIYSKDTAGEYESKYTSPQTVMKNMMKIYNSIFGSTSTKYISIKNSEIAITSDDKSPRLKRKKISQSNIDKANPGDSCMDILQELLNRYGGYCYINYSWNGLEKNPNDFKTKEWTCRINITNISRIKSRLSKQDIIFGLNLQDCTVTSDGSDIFTVLNAYGATKQVTHKIGLGNGKYKKQTVSEPISLKNKIKASDEIIKKYGYIESSVTFANIGNSENLETVAKAYLDEHLENLDDLDIEANVIDLEELGYTGASDINFMDAVKVYLYPHNEHDYVLLPVTKIEFTLDDPSSHILSLSTNTGLKDFTSISTDISDGFAQSNVANKKADENKHELGQNEYGGGSDDGDDKDSDSPVLVIDIEMDKFNPYLKCVKIEYYKWYPYDPNGICHVEYYQIMQVES